MASALLFLVVALSMLAYISYPLLRKSQRRLEETFDESGIELAEEREQIEAALEDLDFEYECGKISDEDYRQLQQELLSKVESEVRSATQEQQSKESIEAEIAKYKAQKGN